MKRLFSFLLMLSFLPGCGGGNPTPQHLSPTDTPTIPEAATHLQMTATEVWYTRDRGGITTPTSCDAPTECDAATDDFRVEFTPENLGLFPDDATQRDLGQRNGVRFIEYSGTSTDAPQFTGPSRPASVDYTNLAGWVDNTFFTLNLWEFEGHQIWNAATAGQITGSNPVAGSGSATWTGAMAGRMQGAHEHQPGEAVLGDSLLTFDFAENNIDVAFTNIEGIETGQSHENIQYEAIPVTNGNFDETPVHFTPSSSAPGYREYISGNFYGTRHEEVGGIFEYGRLIGAFGASRQTTP